MWAGVLHGVSMLVVKASDEWHRAVHHAGCPRQAQSHSLTPMLVHACHLQNPLPLCCDMQDPRRFDNVIRLCCMVFKVHGEGTVRPPAPD